MRVPGAGSATVKNLLAECSLWRQGRCSHLFGRLRDIEIKVERSKSLQARFLFWKQKWLSSAELTFPMGTGTKDFLPCFEIQVRQASTRLASSQILIYQVLLGIFLVFVSYSLFSQGPGSFNGRRALVLRLALVQQISSEIDLIIPLCRKGNSTTCPLSD